MFALSAPVLVIVMGMGIDYVFGLSFKSRWDTAADAASLAAINAANAYVQANPLLATATLNANAISAGQAAGIKAFNSNAGASEGTESVTPTVNITIAGTTFTATANYSGVVGTHFGGLVGVANLSLAGSATATVSRITYINYYIIVDVSNSMGIGSTTTDMQNLWNATTTAEEGSCTFGCHGNWSGLTPSYETIAHNNGITLRIDAAKTAITNVIAQAQAADGNSNIKIGLYEMGISDALPTGGMIKILDPPSANFSALTTAANTIDLLPININNNDGWTQTDPGLNALASAIPVNGTGASASSPINYVFVITDGTEDVKGIGTPCTNYWGGACFAAFDPTPCPTLRTKANVGVIYTTYLPIYNVGVNASSGYNYYYANEILPITPSIEPNLKSCATNTNLYFKADDGPALISAMQQLFASTSAAARLTQ